MRRIYFMRERIGDTLILVMDAVIFIVASVVVYFLFMFFVGASNSDSQDNLTGNGTAHEFALVDQTVIESNVISEPEVEMAAGFIPMFDPKSETVAVSDTIYQTPPEAKLNIAVDANVENINAMQDSITVHGKDAAPTNDLNVTGDAASDPTSPGVDANGMPEGIMESLPQTDFDYTGIAPNRLNWCFPGQPWGDGGCSAPGFTADQISYFWTCGWYWAHRNLGFISMAEVPTWCGRDMDGDGVSDNNDLCPDDPQKSDPGVCGCGVSDADRDGDGAANCEDLCINDANKGAPGVCGCGVADTDSDGDGVADCIDICAGSNDNVDTDGDTVPDGCDICSGADDAVDTDGDGVPDGCDLCGGFDDAIDADGDTIPDACDICGGSDDRVDADGDGVPDGCDVCGGFDDAIDADGDGTPDGCDACAADSNKTAPGVCGCGTVDVDADGDNFCDTNGDDLCTSDINKTAPGICGCGTTDVDADGDGACDTNGDDLCTSDSNKTAPGICGCGVTDVDADGDGACDINGDDLCTSDIDKTAPGVCGCGVTETDADSDFVCDSNGDDECPSDPMGPFGADGCPGPPPGCYASIFGDFVQYGGPGTAKVYFGPACTNFGGNISVVIAPDSGTAGTKCASGVLRDLSSVVPGLDPNVWQCN
jgi:hypothetical protein